MESWRVLPGDLVGYYIAGGPVMHAITLCSIFSLTVILYKLLVFRRARVDLPQFVSRVRAALLKGNVKGAIDVCEQENAPIAAIVKAGLLKHGRPREEIDRALETAAIHELAYLEKYLTVLATITTTAPLLGFFGTVVGMILSFDVIAAQGLNDPGAVAKGISVALLTTAWGLIVAFVSQPFYHYFLSKVAASTREIETVSNILLESLDEMERMGARPLVL